MKGGSAIPQAQYSHIGCDIRTRIIYNNFHKIIKES